MNQNFMNQLDSDERIELEKRFEETKAKLAEKGCRHIAEVAVRAVLAAQIKRGRA
jgi:hypothetical protein